MLVQFRHLGSSGYTCRNLAMRLSRSEIGFQRRWVINSSLVEKGVSSAEIKLTDFGEYAILRTKNARKGGKL